MGAWSNREWGFAAVGVVLLLLTGWVTFEGKSDELTSYATGAALGSIALGFTLGALVRWLWITYGDGIPPVTDAPYWLIVAGVVGVVLALARSGVPDVGGEDLACTPPAAGPVEDGLTLTAPPDAVDQQVRALAAAAAPTGYGSMIEDMRQFVVLDEGGQGVGVLMSMPLDGGIPESDRNDFMAGASDGLAQQGLAPESVEIGGHPAIGAQVPQGYVLTMATGCGALQSGGQSLADAQRILESVVG